MYLFQSFKCSLLVFLYFNCYIKKCISICYKINDLYKTIVCRGTCMKTDEVATCIAMANSVSI